MSVQRCGVDSLESDAREWVTFSGAEIGQAIVAGLYAAHAGGHALNDFTLRAELKATRPLSVLMHEQVTALRDWARERTVPAD